MSKKKVIYTSLTGGYDNLPQYDVVDDSFDYICFSNDWPDGSKQGIWTIKKIPFESDDLTRLSRYVKLQPHKVLQNYDYSVWIDSNLEIKNEAPYKVFNKVIEEDVYWGGVCHPELDCIYEDAKRCILQHKASYLVVKKLLRHYRYCGYPTHNGLLENNLIVRKHNENNIILINDEWWNFFQMYAKRDQLSLCFVFWKNGFQPTLIYPDNVSTHNADGIERKGHLLKNKQFIIRCMDYIERKFNTLRMKHSSVFKD